MHHQQLGTYIHMNVCKHWRYHKKTANNETTNCLKQQQISANKLVGGLNAFSLVNYRVIRKRTLKQRNLKNTSVWKHQSLRLVIYGYIISPSKIFDSCVETTSTKSSAVEAFPIICRSPALSKPRPPGWLPPGGPAFQPKRVSVPGAQALGQAHSTSTWGSLLWGIPGLLKAVRDTMHFLWMYIILYLICINLL